MRFIIVRHGESEMNASGVSQGASSKSNLTELGREQVARLADKLSNAKIDMVFVSSSDRAKQTAEIILAKHPSAKVEFTNQLKEKDTGIFAGRPSGELLEAWHASDLPFGEFQPEGGESWYQAGGRVVSFIKKLIDEYKDTDSTILIVGHGSVFTYLLMWADRFDPKDNNKEKYDFYHPGNTAVSIIEIDQTGEPALVLLKDTSHLE